MKTRFILHRLFEMNLEHVRLFFRLKFHRSFPIREYSDSLQQSLISRCISNIWILSLIQCFGIRRHRIFRLQLLCILLRKYHIVQDLSGVLLQSGFFRLSIHEFLTGQTFHHVLPGLEMPRCQCYILFRFNILPPGLIFQIIILCHSLIAIVSKHFP